MIAFRSRYAPFLRLTLLYALESAKHLTLSTLDTDHDENKSHEYEQETPYIHSGLLTVVNLVQHEQRQRQRSQRPNHGGLGRVKEIHLPIPVHRTLSRHSHAATP